MERATYPILIYANPVAEDDAKENPFAFADEKLRGLLPDQDVEKTIIPSFPRMAKCYGWLPFNRQVVQGIPRPRWPPVVKLPDMRRSLTSGKDYTGNCWGYCWRVLSR